MESEVSVCVCVSNMCGIFCAVTNDSAKTCSSLLNVYDQCAPNIKKRGPDAYHVITLTHQNHNFVFAASVLWLQGKHICKQPIENDNSVFLYNGDIFDSSLILEASRLCYGDTQLLLETLEKSENVVETLLQMRGPYTFIYLNKLDAKLYFGHDIYGRRSLLIGKQNECLVLTSVACRDTGFSFVELPAIGIFVYDLTVGNLELIPWQTKQQFLRQKVSELEKELNMKIVLREPQGDFSNLEFVKPPEKELKLYAEILSSQNCFDFILKIPKWSQNVERLVNLLNTAVYKRISTQPKYCQNCISKKLSNCMHATVGVLFSGGLDCTVLALLADKYVDTGHPIDLLNVAFYKTSDYKTPDRITGLQSLKELKHLRPNRRWNFVEINVTTEKLNGERERHIADLIYPLKTVLDDSLGCALWFASKGKTETYQSPCRVLLVGMGADELFGGYTKHRAALKKQSWLGLHNSLEEDWQNISHRNLARDDRVVSDNGRQLRTPYLDENVVEFLRSLHCWEKTLPTENSQPGLGDKILLRLVAHFLGLKQVALFKKRALQFGSRIANSKENAHSVSPRL